ncbi:hypothetical protein D3C86_1521860 [compost metagenome]
MRSAMAVRGNFTMSSPASGIPFRTTPLSGMSIAGCSSIPIRCMCWTTRAPNFPCADRSTSRARCRVGPLSFRQGLPSRGASLPPKPRKSFLPQHPRLRQERPSIRTSRTGPSRRVVRATELSSCPALSFSWVTVWKRQRPNAPGSTALSIMTAQSPRFPLRWATMFPVSIPIAPCLIFPRPMPANPAAKGSSSLPEAKP